MNIIKANTVPCSTLSSHLESSVSLLTTHKTLFLSIFNFARIYFSSMVIVLFCKSPYHHLFIHYLKLANTVTVVKLQCLKCCHYYSLQKYRFHCQIYLYTIKITDCRRWKERHSRHLKEKKILHPRLILQVRVPLCVLVNVNKANTSAYFILQQMVLIYIQ